MWRGLCNGGEGREGECVRVIGGWVGIGGVMIK